MVQPLVPCPSCARHVLASEERCPFCAADLPEDLEGKVIPGAPRRMSRAAAFMLGATLAVTGCGSDVQTGGAGSTSGDETGDGGPGDDGGGQPHYGGPPPTDAGPDGSSDDGGVLPLYGGPPPMDAGTDADADSGGGQPLYGAPPPPPKDG